METAGANQDISDVLEYMCLSVPHVNRVYDVQGFPSTDTLDSR